MSVTTAPARTLQAWRGHGQPHDHRRRTDETLRGADRPDFDEPLRAGFSSTPVGWPSSMPRRSWSRRSSPPSGTASNATWRKRSCRPLPTIASPFVSSDATVEDGHPSDLLVAHERLGDVHDVVFAHAEHLLRHRARDRDLGVGLPLRVARHADVAVGEHSDDALVVIDDGDAATVAFPHDLRRALKGVVDAARLHARGHQLGYVHGHLPWVAPPRAKARPRGRGAHSLGATPPGRNRAARVRTSCGPGRGRPAYSGGGGLRARDPSIAASNTSALICSSSRGLRKTRTAPRRRAKSSTDGSGKPVMMIVGGIFGNRSSIRLSPGAPWPPPFKIRAARFTSRAR